MKESGKQLESINKVIKYYIDLMYREFISEKDYKSFNE